MKFRLEITEQTLRELVRAHVDEQLGLLANSLSETDIKIEVKSKQNYKAEWEVAAFRAVVEKG